MSPVKNLSTTKTATPKPKVVQVSEVVSETPKERIKRTYANLHHLSHTSMPPELLDFLHALVADVVDEDSEEIPEDVSDSTVTG